MIATGAWSKDLYPEDKRGQFAGYLILFSVAFTMTIGPALGSWLTTSFGMQAIVNGQQGFIPSASNLPGWRNGDPAGSHSHFPDEKKNLRYETTPLGERL